MRKAVTMVVSIDELQRQFRDMKPHAIWFALGYVLVFENLRSLLLA